MWKGKLYTLCSKGTASVHLACVTKGAVTCMLAKAALWLLVISTLGWAPWSWWGLLRHWDAQHWVLLLSVSPTFIAEGTLTVTQDFTAGSESYSVVTIYSAFQSVKWNISPAAVKPVPFKPEPPDIWRSWILWIG